MSVGAGTALIAFAALVLVWGAIAFNRFVRLRNQVRSAWADVDVQLSRRHDLVPSLVATVKGYAAHERGTLEAVTALRTEASSIRSPARLGEVEASLESGIGKLVALAEAYPDLRASESFGRLQRDLVEIEDHLQYARRFYNGSVRDYNTVLQRVPDVVVGRTFRFEPAEFYQADEAERSAPRLGMS